jgi:hypothetical protein
MRREGSEKARSRHDGGGGAQLSTWAKQVRCGEEVRTQGPLWVAIMSEGNCAEPLDALEARLPPGQQPEHEAFAYGSSSS